MSDTKINSISSESDSEKPAATKDGITFFPIPEVSTLNIAFGADDKCYFDRVNLPEVPPVFENMAHKLFFEGGSLPDFHESVDKQKAIRAVAAWLGSFSPAHEAKIATVGYALWVWATVTDIDT